MRAGRRLRLRPSGIGAGGRGGSLASAGCELYVARTFSILRPLLSGGAVYGCRGPLSCDRNASGETPGGFRSRRYSHDSNTHRAPSTTIKSTTASTGDMSHYWDGLPAHTRCTSVIGEAPELLCSRRSAQSGVILLVMIAGIHARRYYGGFSGDIPCRTSYRNSSPARCWFATPEPPFAVQWREITGARFTGLPPRCA